MSKKNEKDETTLKSSQPEAQRAGAAGLSSGGTKGDSREHLVGINYFAGWWREMPNKYHAGGKDWRLEYPDRVATLGLYNEQQTLDAEIAAAADHGVDFFQILWYPLNCLEPGDPHQNLNVAVEQFMASPNASRLRFCLEFCNHAPFRIETDAQWEAACRLWCRAMRSPSYLRVGGRPVFKVHTADQFLAQTGGDAVRVQARWDALRRIAHEAGLPDPLLGAGGDPNGATAGQYDYFATYMEVPGLPMRPELYPYAELLKMAEGTWQAYATGIRKPYLPYLPAGWDPRPWGDPRPSFTRPDRAQWVDALKSVKAVLDQHPLLGIPDGKGGRCKAFTIYAWNEFGEGGIVAPTQGDGMMKLEGIAEVFGGAPRGKHRH